MATASSEPGPARWAAPCPARFLRPRSGCSSPSSSASSCSGSMSIDLFGVPRYILPTPSEIVTKGSADIPRLALLHLRHRRGVVSAIVVAVVLAVPLGLAIAFSSILRRTIYPFFVCSR